MGAEKHHKIPTVRRPAICRIRVHGRLEGSWSDRPGGMQVTEIRATDGQPETILVGRVVDHAMLSGILNSLHEMQLPVLSVECLNSDD